MFVFPRYICRCLFFPSASASSGSFEAHAWRHGGMGDLAEKGPWQITRSLHVVDIPPPKIGVYTHFTPQVLITFSRKTHGCWVPPFWKDPNISPTKGPFE